LAGRSLGRFDGGIGASKKPKADRFDRGIAFNGSVYPTKGRGHGIAGEAAYLDLLARWDRTNTWQAWRKGMTLAASSFFGAAERSTAIRVQLQDPFSTAPAFRFSPAFLIGFTSRESPEGHWTVCLRSRGSEISDGPVLAGCQREEWRSFSAGPNGAGPNGADAGAPPERCIALDFSAVPGVNFNASVIGEVLEDSATDGVTLAADPTDGRGLLCLAVHEDIGVAYFRASSYYERQRLPNGRLQLVEIPVPPAAPPPWFRTGRHLTLSTILSCSCPQHNGLVYARLLTGNTKLGVQDLFPSRSPAGLAAPRRGAADANPEGVRRRFSDLSWARLPEQTCKHCHAVRWQLGCPLAEPTDMPSPDDAYWRDRADMAAMEDATPPLLDPRFLDDLRQSLLSEQAFSRLDANLLAAAVGDAFGVVPQRIELEPLRLSSTAARTGAGSAGAGSAEAARARAGRAGAGPDGVSRQSEQRFIADPAADQLAQFGDWATGRGTARTIQAFIGPGQLAAGSPVEPIPPGVPLPPPLP